MNGFKNVRAYIRGKGIVRTDIAIENGVISKIGEGIPDLTPLAETGDLLLVPGFIDEHIHGAFGADTMDGTHDALDAMSRALLKEGTTSFLATTMTQSDANIKRALSAVAGFGRTGARLLGVHLEGPFISPEYIGAQPAEHVKKPSVEYFKELQSVAGGKIKIVTIAPETDGARELISYLKSSGVTASAGHSGATQKDVERAICGGLSCVTHTFNAQTPLHHRDIGVAGSALLYGELACEVIADTIHVSVPALRVLIKNKPKDKVILITDAMRAKGMGDGVSELGGQTVYVKDGQARLANGALAGSVLKMNEAIKNVVTKCGVGLADAIDFATFNPAQNLGLSGEYGAIAEGFKADFALLDKDFNVVCAVVDGIVY